VFELDDCGAQLDRDSYVHSFREEILLMFDLGGLLVDGRRCPPVAWHILEIIVNVMMVVEVSTRWVAYGKVR
jgi:hypothetical protein